MDKIETGKIIDEELARYRLWSYERLSALVCASSVSEVTGSSGTTYQVTVYALWTNSLADL